MEYVASIFRGVMASAKYLSIPTFITLSGLISGFLSIIFAVNLQFNQALFFLIAAGVCDLFDGYVARKMQLSLDAQEFGKYIDTLGDSVSFGVAPAVFGYAFGLKHPFEVALLTLYVLCGAFRLARFHVLGIQTDNEERSFYTGMPITYIALLLPLTMTAYYILPKVFMRYILDVLYAGSGLLMISEVKVIKPAGRIYFILAGMAIIFLWLYWNVEFS